MRTLDDIIPPSRRKELESTEALTKKPTRSSGGSKFPFTTVLVVIVIIGGVIGGLTYFSSAKVDVTPNSVSVAVKNSFTANQSMGSIPYEIVTAQKIASQSVKSSGTKTVNSPASGTITIYNTQATAQKLIANTRFATAAGLIFRIHTAVTVPTGTTAKPGTVTAKVYADQNGDSYNVAPTSFTVPGFAGTAQEGKIYARSTTAMTGGASGTVPIVDPAVEAQTKSALIAALAPDLTTSLQSQIPSGYVLLPGAATTTYEELAPAPSSTTGMVAVKEQGTITAVVFPSGALAKAIATSVTGLGYQGEAVILSSTNGITFTPTNGFPETNDTTLSFTLTGTAPLVYVVDPARIAAAVAGKTRLAAETALTNYPEVKRAVITLRPVWRQNFPQDPASISVTVLNQ